MTNNKQMRRACTLAAIALAFATAGRAQISLATIVDLAQRNSSTVHIALADRNKAAAAASQTTDVFVPSLDFASGLPALPSVGFMGNPPSIFSSTLQSLVFSMPQKHYIAAAHDGLRAATHALKDAQEQVALDASLDYVELDTLSRQLLSAEQQHNYAIRMVEIEQQRAEAGVDPTSSLLEAQLSAAQFKLKCMQLEQRIATLQATLATLTGLPADTILTDHASIPEIPALNGDKHAQKTNGVKASELLARSKQQLAVADMRSLLAPTIVFSAQYSRDTTLLNNANSYYSRPLKADNFSSGFQIAIPLFNVGQRDKARQSAAEALRAKAEAEQAARQNDVAIAQLNGSLRELDTLNEIATLKRQIADEQLKAVATQLELGNGAMGGPNAQPQLSPKAEQLARIDERQKYTESLDAELDLTKARLNLLRALGHMQDWLNELHGK